MIRYLLDTNIVIYVIKRRTPEVLQTFNQHTGRMAISSMPNTSKTVQCCGSIRASLETQGQTIGVNDLHIAAHACSEGLVLVTNNIREFERAPALQTESWIEPPR